MKRRLFNILAVVALILCLATVALGVLSYWKFDGIAYQSRTSVDYVFSNRGKLTFRHDIMNAGYIGFGRPGWQCGHQASVNPLIRSSADVGTRWNYRLLGFSCYVRGGGSTQTATTWTSWFPTWEVVVPHAAVAALLAVLSALAFRQFRASRRHLGLCPSCGYDVRATPERCPECGFASVRAAPNRHIAAEVAAQRTE